MSRDLSHVTDILEAARLIQSYVEGIDRETFESDIMRQDAVCRRFEIIGEATKRISDEFRNHHTEIPWQVMAGMRDVLIHDYDKVNPARVWGTAVKDVPPLIAQLESLVAPEDE